MGVKKQSRRKLLEKLEPKKMGLLKRRQNSKQLLQSRATGYHFLAPGNMAEYRKAAVTDGKSYRAHLSWSRVVGRLASAGAG